MADKYLGTGRGRQGGQPYGGRQARLALENPLGCPTWKGSTDEQYWSVVGCAIQVDSRSTTVRESGGRRSGCKDKEKQRLRVVDGGRYEIGPGGGRNRMNNP